MKDEEEGFLGEDRIITAYSMDDLFLFEGTITEYLVWKETNDVEHWSWT